ncbi:MAG TPA: putative colanic acid biosynthesis acetyltransferase [Acidobacteriota bacterium]|nr:putative colanic acid biosynthesis acetyltransferase [Acidobacteriota bacterium]
MDRARTVEVGSDGFLKSKLMRGLWRVVWCLLYRPSPTLFHAWRRFLLRLFHARIGKGAHPYPSARVWAPWNLVMEENSCLAFGVDCYCVAPIRIGAHATVSQYAHLCAASRDVDRLDMPVIAAPITVAAGAWVAAGAFIGPGVTIGEGAVVGARSTVLHDVEPWTIVVGNPARFLRFRKVTKEKRVFATIPN